jgi:hypothetical protein
MLGPSEAQSGAFPLSIERAERLIERVWETADGLELLVIEVRGIRRRLERSNTTTAFDPHAPSAIR